MSASSPRMAVAPEVLPPEIWSIVVHLVDDHCWAWFCLRRVCPFLRLVTENVFASILVSDFSLRFAGDYAKTIIAENFHFEPNCTFHKPDKHKQTTVVNVEYSPKSFIFGNFHDPGFFFLKATNFSPPNSKARVVLKFQEQYDLTTRCENVSFQWPSYPWDVRDRCEYSDGNGDIASAVKRDLQRDYPFSLRRFCCKCSPRIKIPEQTAQCKCIERLLFAQSAECLTRLPKEAHFIRFDNKLHSMIIPSLTLDASTRELSFDWRHFLQHMYAKELEHRRLSRPWIRHVSLLSNPSRLRVHGRSNFDNTTFPLYEILEGCRTDSWIFWTQQRDQETLLDIDIQNASPFHVIANLPRRPVR
ncbi:hypothetical protein EJ04DRAFT_512198 [Polyplosphaeria fusca]|uniref:F-box domain-containing protein n=1 Tax=Polyplosphaeria fusca TaxID=682080 RepID=A0A9P4QY23_9PLEO|nr:hypothetical protein EJ04DRAFT_512198 [Polyplosphaeria fusca]